jgi:phage shock protein A
MSADLIQLATDVCDIKEVARLARQYATLAQERERECHRLNAENARLRKTLAELVADIEKLKKLLEDC